MRKKAVIAGSIGAVVLLVLCSLVNVVGYQSVESAGVSESPLFRIRTQKATNQQQNVLTSFYLGKGNESILLFPIKENETRMIIKFIEKVRAMNENEFNRFQNLIILRLSEDKSNNNINFIQILSLLKQIRSDKTSLLITQFANNDKDMKLFTDRCPETSRIGQGCLFVYLLFLIFFVVEYIGELFSVFPTCQESICYGFLCNME
jgi:hypothetical protein